MGATLIINSICSRAEFFLAGTASCRIEVKCVYELFEEYKKKGVIYNPDSVLEEQPWGDLYLKIIGNCIHGVMFYRAISSSPLFVHVSLIFSAACSGVTFIYL